MLIETMKRLDINQSITINMAAIDAIGEYYPMIGKAPNQKKSAEPDEKSCVLVMRSGLVVPVNKTAKSIIQKMEAYRG